VCVCVCVFVQYTLQTYQQFQVQENDRIGWTCEENYCPVVYDIDNTGSEVTRYYVGGAPGSASFPTLNNAYGFAPASLNYIFSAAVDIAGNRTLNFVVLTECILVLDSLTLTFKEH
jgi:hypothetical protein